MFIQRGFVSCKRCEKDGIPPELQWNVPNQEHCLGCGEKLTSSNGCHLFEPVARLVRTFTRTHMFRFDDMGTRKQSPNVDGASDVPRISMSSRVVGGLTAAITWQQLSKDSGEQSGKSWDEFSGKHSDLLVPADLKSVVDWLGDEYPVTWSNLTGVRKQVRMTRYVHEDGDYKLWIELEFCWEVSKQAEEAARFARKYFGRRVGGDSAGDFDRPQTALPPAGRRRVDEAVMTAMGHMWFADCVSQKWWDGLWANEAFSRTVGEVAGCQASGLLSPEDAQAYIRVVGILAGLTPDGQGKASED